MEALGGKILQVNKTKRVNGVLAVTRAIGNDNFLKLKKVGITCLPKITYMPLKGVKGWLLSSDGLFENITTQQWIGIIKKYSDQKVKHVPSDLVRHALHNGSRDNISVIWVNLNSKI